MKIDPEISKFRIEQFLDLLDDYESTNSNFPTNIKNTRMGDYVVSCLKRILDGEDPADAFNLKRGHRPSTENRDICIAINYVELRKQDIKKAAVNLQLQQDWNLKEDSIDRIYKKYKKTAESQFAFRVEAIKDSPGMKKLWLKERKYYLQKQKGKKA